MAAAILLCVLVYGAVEILQLPAATLLILVLIFARVVPRATSIQSSYHILLNALPGYDNMLRLTERLEAAREAHTMIAPDTLPRLAEAVVLEAVSFGYEIPPLLNDVHLTIPANKITALAGALVRHPSLLVLDEATSALDAENEARILDALRELKGRLPVLLISHRESAVRDADVVYEVRGGVVEES